MLSTELLLPGIEGCVELMGFIAEGNRNNNDDDDLPQQSNDVELGTSTTGVEMALISRYRRVGSSGAAAPAGGDDAGGVVKTQQADEQVS